MHTDRRAASTAVVVTTDYQVFCLCQHFHKLSLSVRHGKHLIPAELGRGLGAAGGSEAVCGVAKL